MNKLSISLIALGFLCALSSCSNMSPASRIENNPEIYKALPLNEKELVTKGEICAGMSPKAVFLAWGHPSELPFKGMRDGKSVMRWDYTHLYPVTTVSTWSGMYPYDPYYYYPSTSTSFIPRRYATVSFVDDKVASWSKKSR